MAKKVHVTRTYAPLQFEALEPHRFEDLVRDLLYGYKDWQRLEATGRGGSDDGFDIRAYEKAFGASNSDDTDEDDVEQPVTVEGNLWMIQCKREKQLSAAGITAIINQSVRKEAPPYGYVLAAPVNFTKKSYDAFRSALIDRGVSEFQLLGRAELEDMLYQPKNDRVLFAFFGISLLSRKRSRVTDIRSAVNNKNKLYKVLGEEGHRGDLGVNVLLRDTNDTHYPQSERYEDFEQKPRWKKYTAAGYHPEGIRFHISKYFAYVDTVRKEWDFTSLVNLAQPHDLEDFDARQRHQELWDAAADFWGHLPLWHQGKLVRDGLVPYRDFDLIDKEGDAKYRMPHLYVEFGHRGPFDGFWEFLTRADDGEFHHLEGYKQVSVFPKTLPKIKRGKLHEGKLLEVPSYIASRLRDGQHCYFDFEDKYRFLRQRDAIEVPNPEERGGGKKMYVEVMYTQRTKTSELLLLSPNLEFEIQQQINRKAEPNEEVQVFQLKQVYDFELERRGLLKRS